MKKLIVIAILIYGGYSSFASTPSIDSYDDAGNPITILFTLNNCTPCKNARDYLTQRKIKFQEYTIKSDGDKAHVLYHKAGGGRQFPYLVSGDQNISNFNKYSYTGFFAEVLGSDFLTPAEHSLLKKNFDYTGHAKLVMYSSTSCGYCAKTRQYLQAENIPYTELFIDQDPKAKRHYHLLGASGTPLIYIGYRRIDGFNKPLLASVIEAKLKS